ncbi:MAG: ATP-binding protein [Thermoleophilia bacterium]
MTVDRDPEPGQAKGAAGTLETYLRGQTGVAEDTSPAGEQPAEPTLLVAHYADARTPPDVYPIPAQDTATALREAGDLVERLARAGGGRLPGIAIREIISNLAHAGAGDAVVSLLDGGNTLRVSDRGPGLPDKERALLPGFTTAGPALRTLLRGVGSGLGIARECLAVLGGTLELDDNLGGGTVVTASVPPLLPETTPVAAPAGGVKLSERQLRTLLIILELGPVGPTPVARELRVSPSTAYRDLVLLEEAGLVSALEGGLRSATDEGLAYLQTVL